jgi:hypothetical protein
MLGGRGRTRAPVASDATGQGTTQGRKKEETTMADKTKATHQAKTVTITKKEYDRLLAADKLLGRVFCDQGYMDYDEVYPELLKAAGH